MSLLNQDNLFFVNENIIDNNNYKINKEELSIEENIHRNSFSTNATFENDFQSDEEIDFNQDFFPKNKPIKFTDFLVDNWEQKIKIHLIKIKQLFLKIEKNNSNANDKNV